LRHDQGVGGGCPEGIKPSSFKRNPEEASSSRGHRPGRVRKITLKTEKRLGIAKLSSSRHAEIWGECGWGTKCAVSGGTEDLMQDNRKKQGETYGRLTRLRSSGLGRHDVLT